MEKFTLADLWLISVALREQGAKLYLEHANSSTIEIYNDLLEKTEKMIEESEKTKFELHIEDRQGIKHLIGTYDSREFAESMGQCYYKYEIIAISVQEG